MIPLLSINWPPLSNLLHPGFLIALSFTIVFCILVYRLTTPRRRRIPRVARLYGVRRVVKGDTSLVVIE